MSVIIDALKKAGITYTPKIGGAGADFGNVTKETIDIFCFSLVFGILYIQPIVDI